MKLFCILVFFFILSVSFCCELTCQHGGTPKSDCTGCESCFGAWSGTYCETWDSSLPYSVASQDLVLLIQGSREESNKRNEARLSTALGQGADITTGDLKFPILGLEYNAGTFQYGSRSWLMAKDTSAVPLGSPSVTTQSNAFINVGAFIQTVYSYNSSSVINPTLFSKAKDLPDILEQYFGTDGSVVASQQKVSLFTSTLTQSTASYQFDTRAKLALQSLPPAYDTPVNKALYRLFIDNWGTHGVYSSVAGGMVEQLALTKTSVFGGGRSRTGYTKEQVESMATAEFLANLLNGGTASIPDGYRNARTLSTLSCIGGNAAELCSRDLLESWKNQIDALPYPVSYTVFDYTDLLQEPLRSNIRSAIQAYVDETHARYSSQFPPCKYGEFNVDTNMCICDNENVVGKTCDTCVRGWGGNKCTMPACRGRCRYCSAPGDCLDNGDCGRNGGRPDRSGRPRPDRRVCPSMYY